MTRAVTGQYVFGYRHPVMPSRGGLVTSSRNRFVIEQFFDTKWHIALLTGPGGSGVSWLAQIWGAEHHIQIVTDADAAIAALLDKQAIILDISLSAAPESGDEEKVFHALNLARENDLHFLLAGDFAMVSLPDLKSRLNALPRFELAVPDENAMRLVWQKMAADRQWQIDNAVAEYCLARLPRSFSILEKMISELDAVCQQHGKPATIGLAKQVLAEIAMPDSPVSLQADLFDDVPE